MVSPQNGDTRGGPPPLATPLLALKKQQIYVRRSQTSTGKLGKGADSSKIKTPPSLPREWRINTDQSINQLMYSHHKTGVDCLQWFGFLVIWRVCIVT